ncbi:hypothetical protein HDU99_002405 [Rhizoclosmatium hyalinum]|nr:hypothetical protein HDU99_002405 [Rhizoclosmatium hyalinum]
MAARNLMYTPHPTKAGRYCQKYTFIGKGDDDEAINLRALVRHIKTAKKENVPQLAGFMMYEDAEFKERVWYAHGMLYFGSPELVEWIHTSPIPQEQPELLALPEDHVFGYLLRESKIYMKRTEWRPYYFETHKDEWMVTDDTIIAHPCKALDSFFRCMTLFDRVTQDHPLLIPENAKLRLEHLGLLATDEVVNQTIKKVKEAINKEPMFIMAQFNRLLLGQAVYLTIAEFNLPKETIDKIITKVTFDLEKGANGAVKVPVNVETLKSYMKEYSR